MDTLETRTVFTKRKRSEINKYKKQFDKKWKNDPVNNPVRFKPSTESGLTAKQVDSRIDDCLVNYVKRGTTKSVTSILVTNICTFYNLLAIIVAIILIYNMLVLQPKIPADTEFDPMGITSLFFLLVFGANIVIGVFQELRAKFTIEKLTIIASAKVTVVRDGVCYQLLPDDIVLDDIVVLEAGGQVQADGILQEGIIEVNESLLTGESVPIQKKKGDKIFAGSFVVSGIGRYRVDKVGKDNYIQTMAKDASRYIAPRSELFNSLKSVIKVISGIIVILASVLVAIQLVGQTDITTADVSKIITQTSGAILGMIPAGMFLLSSLALVVGVINLGKENTWVRELYCIEMLARVDTLCLDKTGTITDGTMKVVDVITIKNDGKKVDLRKVLSSMLYALDDNNQTSVALKDYFGQECILKAKKVLPFSSARKLSAVSFNSGAGTFVIGAPEFMFSNISSKLDDVITKFASQGYRVLAVGKSVGEIKGDDLPNEIKPIALITLQDNIRREAPQTIKWFRDNGVDIRIISGDNPITVSEVARRAGVVGAEKYISLYGLSPVEIRAAVKEYTVFGRVTPEQKLILVKELKNSGRMVAMTGDGVNDILALREADCSIAMASGSEAARNVSQLVLLDSNFSSMPKVVLEGRRVVNNVQKSSSLFLFKTLFTIMLTCLCIFTNKGQYFFNPSNLLILETLVIGLPSLMLALERNSQQINGKFLFNILKNSLSSALVVVLFIGCLILFRMFDIFHLADDAIFQTMVIYAVLTTGFAMLYKMIRPVNIYRGIMFVCVAALSLFLVLAFPGYSWEWFGMVVISDEVHILMVLLMLFMAYALISLFDAMFSKIKLSTNDKQQNLLDNNVKK